jgi:cytochrome c oxidase assembly factor CtaG
MFNLLLANDSHFWRLDLWYALPAIIAVSLVYAATRHEKMQPLLIHAGRTAVWIVGFMFAVFVALEAINWQIGP